MTAFDKALRMEGKLPPSLFDVRGFSGRKFRLFLNNLMSEIPTARYLEIGVFCGASFCSAVYENKITAFAVDNWSWDGSNLEYFKRELALYGAKAETHVLEKNFREVAYLNEIQQYDVLFYDGSHREIDQYDGITIPHTAMAKDAIVIVDDWNWEHVRTATFRALSDLNREIIASVEVQIIHDNGNLPPVNGPHSDWHNGMFAAVVQAPK
jgi:predicted O-methyltransferase YrrM